MTLSDNSPSATVRAVSGHAALIAAGLIER